MKKTLLMIWILMLALVFPAVLGEEAQGAEMSLLAVNVRKADALLLRSGESAYLIDAGSEESADTLLAALEAEGVTRLTGIILTHTHADHTGGLPALLDSGITIENIYASAYYNKKKESKHPAVKALRNTDLDLSVIFLSRGDSLPLDGGKLTVIGPLAKDEEDENNNSLVLLAEGGGGSILLTGDMEFPEERSLLNAELIPRADVLKIGNHGEGDATSEALIAAVKPSLAVISTNSEDEPDTPDRRVVRLLSTWNVPVLLTESAPLGVLVTIRNGEILTDTK